MGRSYLALVALVVCATGCSGKSAQQAIGVTVRFTPSSRATCVRVVASGEGGELLTQPIARGEAAELKVAVLPGPELTGEISFRARGYVGQGCDEPLALNEESASQTASFAPGVQKVTLVLTGADPSADADRDGYKATSAGGPDCADLDPARNPSTAEDCANGLDDDCSGAVDCADLSCLAKPCSDGNRCTHGETCASDGTCGLGDPVLCNQPPRECDQPLGQCQPDTGSCQYEVDTGSACATGICRGDGVCVSSSTEVLCGNGLDDDGDLAVDCADPDCASQSCSDLNACTVADVCQGGTCTPGAPLSCASAPGPCFVSPGTCNTADGGCSYTMAPKGTSCPAGECRSDGGCGLSELGAACANSVDDDGDGLTDCEDPSCAAQTCDDGDPCTTAEICSTSGKCSSGSKLLCSSPPGQCFEPAGTCTSDGGCSYAIRFGACDGGYCLADGGCAPSAFPYLPSNFDPAGLTPPSSVLNIDCASAIFDSTPGSGSPFLNWCAGQPQPLVQTVTQNDGSEAALLALEGLQITTGSSLRVVGSRPVIFAVHGNAEIRGRLLASGVRSVSGAGADRDCIAAAYGTAASGTTGGGGGGGFGTAGARGGQTAQGASGGAAGGASGNAAIVPLRGGCKGGNGGASGDLGGGGGGGLQLSVSGTLAVSGVVASAGGGGNGGNFWNSTNGGGGGGGSGGAVLLEAQRVVLSAGSAVTANGGSGGEGDGNNGDVNYAGDDGVAGSASTAVPASGANGSATTYGGPGGNGGAGVIAPTVGLDGINSGSGGGGGGSVGRIRINSASSCSLGGIISPPATSNRAGANGCP